MRPATSEAFVPRIVSLNLTYRCNLRCAHCYNDAGGPTGAPELSTGEVNGLLDQIAGLGSPIVILSGGEPMLRNDLAAIARHGSARGLRMALGSNGTLIDDAAALDLAAAGIRKAAISLDSATPAVHDRFRGHPGAWAGAMGGIRACQDAGIGVQLNTTVTTENCDDLDALLDLGEELGIRDVQVFFLVPAGRGRELTDVAPAVYESLIRGMLERIRSSHLAIRPTCAPQFTRIAAQVGVTRSGWTRGCIAGRHYCRVTPTGEVTPCPYLPLAVGSVRETPFAKIWHGSPVLRQLRDPGALRGRCGRCEYNRVCGGCRARAYGAADPGSGAEAYLGEDPWCRHEPSRAAGAP